MLVFDVVQMPAASLKLRLQLGATCHLSGSGIVFARRDVNRNSRHWRRRRDLTRALHKTRGDNETRVAHTDQKGRVRWQSALTTDSARRTRRRVSSASDRGCVSQTRLHRPLRILCCTWNMGNEQPPCDLDQWFKIDKE